MERATLAVVAANLVMLPWWLGAMWPNAQFTSLGIAVLGFVMSLLPRNYTAEHAGTGAFRLHPWPKLIRFPIFWGGLAFLLYILIQALNPAYRWTTDGTLQWMKSIPHVSWLPQGYEAPYLRWNPWRILVVYTSAWLTVCTLWVAFTRRRSAQLLVIVLSLNGVLLALVGVGQQLIGTTKIFGVFNSPNPSFFASFVYKNHGAIYLFVVLAATCGLAGWYYLRGLRRMEKSNPAAVIAFLATIIAISILLSYARGATLIMLVFLVGGIGAFAVHQILLPSESRRPMIAIVFILIFGYFLKTGVDSLRFEQAWDRVTSGLANKDGSLEARARARAATFIMLKDNWVRGLGAGSFRYMFPDYQARDIVLLTGDHTQPKRRIFWEHAHCDIMQFPIELGATGMLLLLFCFGYWTVKLLRNYFWENPLSACLVFGALLTVVSAWWDFPFQNPAILITWCALWPLAAQWAQFEESGSGS